MSRVRSPFEEDNIDDGIATKCWLCGGYIHAGTYPDICKGCMPEFELECALYKMAREFRNDKDRMV